MRNSAIVSLCGHLGADIEIKEAKSGKNYGILTLAVNVPAKKPDSGERIQKANWFRIHVWNQAILSKSEHLKKGEKVLIVGDLRNINKKVLAEDSTEIGQYPVITINIRNKSGITILKKNFPTVEGNRDSISGTNSRCEEKVA